MNERKPGGKNEMPRNAKTRTRRIIFCPPEHINMLSGNTRTSHPGGQGRVTWEDKNSASGKTIQIGTCKKKGRSDGMEMSSDLLYV